ncbi:MAG: hypothetical protein QOE83_2404 [Actinomycetota bacterium]|nr:hypothetical protein [Actinomycetota bacterium]
MFSVPRTPMLHLLTKKEGRRWYGMRNKLGSWRHLMLQGAVLATLLLAAGARWKGN